MTGGACGDRFSLHCTSRSHSFLRRGPGLPGYKTVQNVLSEWIQGLPSTFNIDFYNYKIIEVAKTFGNLPEQLSEKEEDKVISNWFSFIAAKTLQLFAKNGIPTSYFVS